jgi:hypothetical protein
MEEQVREWLFDPVIGKAVAAVVSLIVLYVLGRFAQHSVVRAFWGDSQFPYLSS